MIFTKRVISIGELTTFVSRTETLDKYAGKSTGAGADIGADIGEDAGADAGAGASHCALGGTEIWLADPGATSASLEIDNNSESDGTGIRLLCISYCNSCSSTTSAISYGQSGPSTLIRGTELSDGASPPTVIILMPCSIK